MKRIIRLAKLFVGIALCAALFLSAASAAGNAEIVVSNENVSAGGVAEVEVSLRNNPGFTCMTLHVSYDTSVFTLTEVEDAGVLGATVHNPNLAYYPYVLCWANDTVMQDYTVNSTIVTLKFAVKDTAAAGKYPITVSYDNAQKDEIINAALKTVDFEVLNGSITVAETASDSGKINNDLSWEIDRDADSLDISGTVHDGQTVCVAGYDSTGKMSFIEMLSEVKVDIDIPQDVLRLKILLLNDVWCALVKAVEIFV